MQKRKKTLTGELAGTVLILGIAMLVVWVIFYVEIHRLLEDYVMSGMESVSEQVLSEMESSFIRAQNAAFELSRDEDVRAFFKENDTVEHVGMASGIEEKIGRMLSGCIFADNVVFTDKDGRYYRFTGKLENSEVKRLVQVLDRNRDGSSHIQLRLGETDYLCYVTSVFEGTEKIGSIVMLKARDDLKELFEQRAGEREMRIALSAEDKVILTNYDKYIDIPVSEILDKTEYAVYKEIGFTPFGILVSYENAVHTVNILFMVVMAIIAVLLFALFEVFLSFWRKKFFTPIQSVITEVEGFKGGKGEQLEMTGMEHFDGLIAGINDMVERIEQKEREIYEANYSLQEAELKRQKALIVSLKKQISAHFTVNVLSIIKALSSTGENEKAGMLCDGLSFLLRYANAGDAYISGMEEFFVLEKYAEIMEIRYPGKFTVNIDVADELEDIEIPRMLLQPVVENSIVHGIIGNESKVPGSIHVYACFEDEAVLFNVEDNGCGMNEEVLEELRDILRNVDGENTEVEGLSHVALVNIERRIRSYFGNGFGMAVESQSGIGTKISVRLPKMSRLR